MLGLDRRRRLERRGWLPRLPFRATPPPPPDLIRRLIALESIIRIVGKAPGYCARVSFDVGGIVTVRDGIVAEARNAPRGLRILAPRMKHGKDLFQAWALPAEVEAVVIERTMRNVAAMEAAGIDKVVFRGRNLEPDRCLMVTFRGKGRPPAVVGGNRAAFGLEA